MSERSVEDGHEHASDRGVIAKINLMRATKKCVCVFERERE